MKRYILPLLLIAAIPAYAADEKAPPNPTCGATAADCQTLVDNLQKQLIEMRLSYAAVRSQRDSIQQANSQQTLDKAVRDWVVDQQKKMDDEVAANAKKAADVAAEQAKAARAKAAAPH